MCTGAIKENSSIFLLHYPIKFKNFIKNTNLHPRLLIPKIMNGKIFVVDIFHNAGCFVNVRVISSVPVAFAQQNIVTRDFSFLWPDIGVRAKTLKGFIFQKRPDSKYLQDCKVQKAVVKQGGHFLLIQQKVHLQLILYCASSTLEMVEFFSLISRFCAAVRITLFFVDILC
jgi:hypothetical protein